MFELLDGMPYEAPSLMNPKYWSFLNHPDAPSSSLFAAGSHNSTVSPTLPQKCLGNLNCVAPNGKLAFLDSDTKFFSRCFLSSTAVIWALMFLFPLAMRIHELRSLHGEGKRTARGQIATLAAIWAPVLAFLQTVVHENSIIVPVELVVWGVSIVAACLHHVQDSRVAVCSQELLLFWLVESFCYFGWALDAYLRTGFLQAWLQVLAGISAILAFTLELWNPERSPKYRYDDFSVFSKCVLGFALPVLAKSYREDIDQKDFPAFPADMESSYSGKIFEEALDKRMGHLDKNPEDITESEGRFKVMFALNSLAGKNVFFSVVFSLLKMACDLYSPFMLMKFLHALTQFAAGEEPLYPAYYTAVLFAVVPFASLSLETLATIQTCFISAKVRAALLIVIYRKALNLCPQARENFDTAKIMNLMNIDSQQVLSLTNDFAQMLVEPIVLIVTTYQLWQLLGYSFLGALAVYALFAPAQSVMTSRFGALLPALMKTLDNRTKITSNLFRSIKSLKLYAWEAPFLDRLADSRKDQLKALRTLREIIIVLSVIYNSISEFVAVTIFTLFLYFRQGVLSAEVAFPALLLLQLLSGSMLMVPLVIVSWSQGLVSCGRLYQFLAQKDHLREGYEHIKEGAVGFNETAVAVDNATISWNGVVSEEKIALENISFEAKRGDFVCVVGRVGSGKSALLRSLCGELSLTAGSITLKGSVSYSAQESWLQNMTLRENILFGQVLDQDWYDRVIDACELRRDIADIPDGDNTNVGERGITLSGGQKARVTLARAVYSRSDVILLDDVLSAVDEHVSKALIEKLFSVNGLLANRTVILATNNIKVLSQSSKIIALTNKKIAEIASFSEVIEKGSASEIHELVKEFGSVDDLENQKGADRLAAIKERGPTDLEPTAADKPIEYQKFDIYAQNSEEEEEKTVSSMKPFIRYYSEFSSKWIAYLGFAFMFTTVLFRNGVFAYLGVVASHNFTDLFSARWYFAGYFAITLGVALSLFWNMYYIDLRLSLENSQIIHDRMVWATMRAPMRFFDRTPLGRLINRFTQDLNSIDNGFAMVGESVVRASLNVLISLIPVLLGSPQVLFVVIPLGWWANYSRKLYVPAQRKITRIYAAANSPLLSHIEESMKGQSIVRAFGQTQRFEDIFVDYTNYWVSASFFRLTLSRWIQVRIQLVSLIMSFFSALGVTQLIGWNVVGVSYAGVVLNFCERIGLMVGQSINAIASAEVSGVALERVLEYVDLEPEAPYHIEATEPAPSWPSKGEITFDNLTARYTPEGPDVLKNLSLKVNSGEKIGVVGRTGSGKSTLTLAIFRLLEAHAGAIEMDKVNTSILGLKDLRSKLSIVPQDAQIFDSTVRDNLDPFGKADDARLWEVLELCHLKEHFEKLGGLDTELNDSGGQLSRGQAQLLCLGRALLHETRVLVLDEATASVDHKTDQIIQETIRKNMSERTVITIAHRLNTIMDSDRILVLDKGEIKEFDTPERLLEAKGLFYGLYTAEAKEEKEEKEEDDETN